MRIEARDDIDKIYNTLKLLKYYCDAKTTLIIHRILSNYFWNKYG